MEFIFKKGHYGDPDDVILLPGQGTEGLHNTWLEVTVSPRKEFKWVCHLETKVIISHGFSSLGSDTMHYTLRFCYRSFKKYVKEMNMLILKK